MDLGSIRGLLSSAGWKDKHILRAFADGELDLPVPVPTSAGSARDAFLHLLAFTALFAWVVSLVMLLFAYVDIALPDPAWQPTGHGREMRDSGIRAGLATIVVAYPAFLLLWSYLLRDVGRHPEKGQGAVRRWLTYLSLFVGAITLATDVITLVFFMFEGQLTARFLTKVLVLFLITAAGIAYLTWAMRAEPEGAA